MIRSISRRSGFTLVELLAVSAVVSLLGAQVFPFIQDAREAARRTQCQNHLKMIGISMHNYHDTYLAFPMGWDGVDLKAEKPEALGVNGWGWAARLTPYMDQAGLYTTFDFTVRVDDAKNLKAIATLIKEYRCPSDTFLKKTWKINDAKNAPLVELSTANYVASFGTDDLAKCEKTKLGEECQGNGLFFHNSYIKMSNIIDGTSNTLAVGERIGDEKIDHLSTWAGVVAKGKHPFARILGSSNVALDAKERHASDYLSAHKAGLNFLICDGSIRFIANKIDLKIFQALTTRAGNEEIPNF